MRTTTFVKKSIAAFKPVMRIALLVVCFLQLSFIELLDPPPGKTLMSELAPVLESLGIDAMQDWRSAVQTKGRPVLAPLAYAPVTSYELPKWGRELDEEIIKAVAVTRNRGQRTFSKNWELSPKERIFFSFAKEDAVAAESVVKALEAKGYVVFAYLRTGRAPVFSTTRIAYYMRTAKTHLVLDTKTAREKSGVLAEKLVYAKYWSPEIIADNERLEAKLKDALSKREFSFSSYEEVVKRFRLLKEYKGKTEAQVKKIIAGKYGIKESDFASFLQKKLDTSATNLSTKYANYKESYTPLMYNRVLIDLFESATIQDSPLICSYCHLPRSFPECLPVLQAITH